MKSFPWGRLIYYGEVFGFLLAWVIGVVVAMEGVPPENEKTPSESLAVASTPAVQPTP